LAEELRKFELHAATREPQADLQGPRGVPAEAGAAEMAALPKSHRVADLYAHTELACECRHPRMGHPRLSILPGVGYRVGHMGLLGSSMRASAWQSGCKRRCNFSPSAQLITPSSTQPTLATRAQLHVVMALPAALIRQAWDKGQGSMPHLIPFKKTHRCVRMLGGIIPSKP